MLCALSQEREAGPQTQDGESVTQFMVSGCKMNAGLSDGEDGGEEGPA